MEITKQSEDKIKVVRSVEQIYSYPDLLTQKRQYEEQKQAEINYYDNEIAKLDVLIAECKKLGMKENNLK